MFRLDEDQCARRNAQKYLKVIDPDYYEFEGVSLMPPRSDPHARLVSSSAHFLRRRLRDERFR